MYIIQWHSIYPHPLIVRPGPTSEHNNIIVKLYVTYTHTYAAVITSTQHCSMLACMWVYVFLKHANKGVAKKFAHDNNLTIHEWPT